MADSYGAEIIMSDDFYQSSRNLFRKHETVLCQAPSNIILTHGAHFNNIRCAGSSSVVLNIISLEGSDYLWITKARKLVNCQANTISTIVTWCNTADPCQTYRSEIGDTWCHIWISLEVVAQLWSSNRASSTGPITKWCHHIRSSNIMQIIWPLLTSLQVIAESNRGCIAQIIILDPPPLLEYCLQYDWGGVPRPRCFVASLGCHFVFSSLR